MRSRFNTLSLILRLMLPLSGAAQFAVAKTEPGLAVMFNSPVGSASDALVTPSLSLFVEFRNPPTPFVPAGPFQATWEGTISAEPRSDFFFEVELNGSLKF